MTILFAGCCGQVLVPSILLHSMFQGAWSTGTPARPHSMSARPPVTREDRQPWVISQPISAAKSDAHQTWSLIDTVLRFWILLRQCFLLSVGGHHGGTGKLHSRTPDQLQDHPGKQIAAKQVSGTRTGGWNAFQSGSRGESRPVLSRQQSVFGSRGKSRYHRGSGCPVRTTPQYPPRGAATRHTREVD